MDRIQKFIAFYSIAAIAMFFAAPYAFSRIGSGFLATSAERFTASVGASANEKPDEGQTASQFAPIILDPHTLEAKSAIVFDIKNGVVLYEKNANAQLPLASITKLMTAHVAHTALHSDDVVTITKESLQREGDSSLIPSEEWNAGELSDFMLVTSSNDAAAALANAVGNKIAVGDETPRDAFIRAMNSAASDIGLQDTKFIDETGLDTDSGVATAYGSAKDVATLLGYIERNEPTLIEATTSTNAVYMSLSGVSHAALNTNEAIPKIPTLIGGKTGFTDLAGGNLAIVFDRSINEPIAVVVLGSTKEGRFPDIEKLVTAALPN